ncbi:MAG: VC0807 family protein [Acidimicrobiales bacterium]
MVALQDYERPRPIASYEPAGSSAAGETAHQDEDGCSPGGLEATPVPHRHGHEELHLPSLLASLRHALPTVLESFVGPLLAFYIFLAVVGYKGAVIAGFVWAGSALLRRLVRRERVPATLVFGTLLLGVRSAIALLTGSVFIYFAQPVAGTIVVGLVFLASTLTRQPLAERLAHDFCPLDPSLVRRNSVRRFFRHISLLWAVVMLVNSASVLWLLLHQTLGAFVFERAAVTWSLTGIGIALSTWWFIRVMRHEGVVVRFGRRTVGQVA